ncbi:hypothetical protein Tco_0900610, partial [Tanacetum coccineum]
LQVLSNLHYLFSGFLNYFWSRKLNNSNFKNPPCIIYQDKLKKNRLMRLDKLYKFCDGTLTDVRSVLDDIAKNWRMEYLPTRDLSRLDRQRPRIMIKKIDCSREG